jgi:hypothetical protein
VPAIWITRKIALLRYFLDGEQRLTCQLTARLLTRVKAHISQASCSRVNRRDKRGSVVAGTTFVELIGRTGDVR